MKRRIKLLKCTGELLLEVLRAGSRGGQMDFRIECLPEDVRMYSIHEWRSPFVYQGEFNTVAFVVESDTFDEIEEGDPIPELEIKAFKIGWKCKGCDYDKNSFSLNACEVCGRGKGD